MTLAELLLQDFDTEMSNTRRSLERVPEGKNDWTLHEKSTPLGKLAMHCAAIPRLGSTILESDTFDMADPKRQRASTVFVSRAACLGLFDESAAACRSALAGASDERLAGPWRAASGERVVFDGPRFQAFRQLCLNHLVHHVAQLGVCLRLNDIPVPALYGASADEQPLPSK